MAVIEASWKERTQQEPLEAKVGEGSGEGAQAVRCKEEEERGGDEEDTGEAQEGGCSTEGTC